MAAQAGINSTSINDTILASNIAQFIIPTPHATPLYEALAMMFDCSGIKSNVLDIPRWDAFPATEETVEADEVVSVSYTTSKKSITGVMYSTRALITDQAIQDSSLLSSDMVNQLAANIRNTLDIETLELFKTATNQSDNTGANLTISLLQTALALFRAQRPTGEVAFVGSTNQIRDLQKSIVDNGNGGLLHGSGTKVFESMAIDGYRGPWSGMHIFESSNISEADATNDHGGFVAVVSSGPGSPPSMSGFGMGVWQGVEAKGLYTPHRHGLDTTVSARAGVSRTAEHLVRGFISKKAAA